ncbi:MAG TPA: TIM barrel protein, partial [Bryobacteraceae bacterium]|nr:TIM barrel protein [Bryobacteraceae bacterium]
MTRRSVFQTITLGMAACQAARPESPGRLKQSVARWIYTKIPMDEFSRSVADMGLRGIDLLDPADWPTAQKYGLVSTVGYSGATIPDGWNRRENHDRLEKQMQESLARAAAAKVPNVITFSGYRRGMADDVGKENCILGLKRVAKMAEDSGVTIVMELLNSKVDHKDYMCDHTAWGVDVMKAVGSPRVKLLYDIYHMQIMEGDIIRTIRENIAYIGHFHTGGVPGRHELDDTQELQWRTIATAIADLDFQGFVG